jgi:hypothetical protein
VKVVVCTPALAVAVIFSRASRRAERRASARRAFVPSLTLIVAVLPTAIANFADPSFAIAPLSVSVPPQASSGRRSGA